MATVLWGEVGDTEKAKENYEKALKTLESEPEGVELANLYGDMAHMHYRTKEVAAALSWANKALELAKKLNDYEVIASSYASLGTIFHFMGDMQKARECHERGLKIALDHGYMATALREYNNFALALRPEEQEKKLECCEKGYELAKRVGDVGHQSWIGVQLAYRSAGMGDLARTISLAEESVALDTKVANLPNLAYSKGALGVAYVASGEWDKGEQLMVEALSISQKLGQWQQITGNYWWLAWLNLCRGEFGRALELLEKMNAVYDSVGTKYDKTIDSNLLIMVYLELGEIDKAERLVESLEKLALEVKRKDILALAYLRRGMLFRSQKKWKESIEFFEKGLQQHEAMNARRWNVINFARMVLYEYARVYLDRNEEGDREKAYNMLNQALEIFQKLGAKKDIEMIIAKKRLLTA
jgi:tetratricopeptide (TPR) repeat protein